jgi:hypothetical protein
MVGLPGPEEVRHARATADPLIKLRSALLGAGIDAREIGSWMRPSTEVHTAADVALDHEAPHANYDAKRRWQH